jgi:hypothetical protein
MTTSRSDILHLIDLERERQTKLWGDSFDSRNTVNDWVAFITRYLARASGDSRSAPSRCSSEGRAEFEAAMVQVAALAVASIEASQQNDGPAPRHYD